MNSEVCSLPKWGKTPEERRAYSRAYSKLNKEKIAEKAHRSYVKNKDKRAAYDKARRVRDRDKILAYQAVYRAENYRKRLYGLTPEDFDFLILKQGGVCLLCEEMPKRERKGDILHVDHDHVTGKVRGLLCAKCNTGIGLLRENPKLLERAALYLRGELHRG